MATTSGSTVQGVNHFEAYAQHQRSPAQDVQGSAEDTMIGVEDAVPQAFSMTGSRKTNPTDLSKLSETFSELDARLHAIIAALNDDIQIVIGSAQIQDSKVMKRQADLTMLLTQTTMHQTNVPVRQTRWTVALAIVAAFYLLMTLVTGIYGMNTKDISGDKGPRWWWVVVTWAVTMGITVCSVGRCAREKWRWYREAKVAVNQVSTDGIPGAQHHGKAKPPSGEADGLKDSSIKRRKHLWRKFPQSSQHDGTRSTV
jgi:hypothetical protein